MQNMLLSVSAPPFWHCGRTIEKSMRWVLLALMPAAVMAVVNWGLPALGVMTLSVGVAISAEILACKLMGRPVRVGDGNAALIGLLFAFLLPASAPWWLAAFGAAMAVLLGKTVFGGLGSSPLSPPAVGWAIVLLSWPLLVEPNTALLSTDFIDPLIRLKYFGAQAAQTAISWQDLLLGHQIGALGASQVGMVLLGGLLLCAQGILRWEIAVAFLAGTVAVAACFHVANPDIYATPLFHVLTGSTVFAAFFLATEPACSPNRQIPMVIFGLMGGALVVLIRNFGMYADAAPFAVLLVNLIMPQLELIRPRPFGVTGGK